MRNLKIGDKVGLNETGIEWYDTFAGTEVEVMGFDYLNSCVTVRTHNGHELFVPPDALLLPQKRRGGRKPVEREPGEKIVKRTITITESEEKYLLSLSPRNLSAAVRQLIKERKDHV